MIDRLWLLCGCRLWVDLFSVVFLETVMCSRPGFGVLVSRGEEARVSQHRM